MPARSQGRCGGGGRSVETPSLLSRDTRQGEGVTRCGERRVHALAALLYSTLRQPDGGERGEAVRDVGLDVDEIGVDAEHRGGADAGEHDLTPCPPLRFAERGDAMTPS